MKFQGNAVTPLCQMYRHYFRDRLRSSSEIRDRTLKNLLHLDESIILSNSMLLSKAVISYSMGNSRG
ncbi:MAG: hypothetical protein RID09_20760 [Coleofasciculus sp. G1-WW12-02]|uniref:hypothetical protein n=1 Tax=Coleofasciculus sp. G1-WW12-02 TaxID=3068483 RepID=UPI003300D3DC